MAELSLFKILDPVLKDQPSVEPKAWEMLIFKAVIMKRRELIVNPG